MAPSNKCYQNHRHPVQPKTNQKPISTIYQQHSYTLVYSRQISRSHHWPHTKLSPAYSKHNPKGNKNPWHAIPDLKQTKPYPNEKSDKHIQNVYKSNTYVCRRCLGPIHHQISMEKDWSRTDYWFENDSGTPKYVTNKVTLSTTNLKQNAQSQLGRD